MKKDTPRVIPKLYQFEYINLKTWETGADIRAGYHVDDINRNLLKEGKKVTSIKEIK